VTLRPATPLPEAPRPGAKEQSGLQEAQSPELLVVPRLA
jgi:hypothetical protein